MYLSSPVRRGTVLLPKFSLHVEKRRQKEPFGMGGCMHTSALGKGRRLDSPSDDNHPKGVGRIGTSTNELPIRLRLVVSHGPIKSVEVSIQVDPLGPLRALNKMLCVVIINFNIHDSAVMIRPRWVSERTTD